MRRIGEGGQLTHIVKRTRYARHAVSGEFGQWGIVAHVSRRGNDVGAAWISSSVRSWGAARAVTWDYEEAGFLSIK